MEFLVEATGDLLLDLKPNYDAIKQTFLLDSQRSTSGSSVRIIENKLIPAQHPPNAIGGGSHILDPTNQTNKVVLYDTFSGIIDGISGDILHGTRSYILTGEEYEGPFCNNMRDGEGAIVKNVYLPSIRSKAMPNEVPRFYGTYRNDSPYDGTLIVPGRYTYHGPLIKSLPHGDDGTIVYSSGLKYEGSFRDGSYHGQGIETETAFEGGGIYKGQFISGLRQGYGTYIIQSRGGGDEDDDASSEKSDERSRKENMAQLHIFYKYQGQWNDNRRQGEGEEKTSTGDIYRGQFHSDERHGYGMLSFPRPDSKNKERTTPTQNATTTDSSTVLVSAEGIWRAGIPLDGTYGWTLTYQNGDVYTGFASNFVPLGYGVKRHVNKDIYSGEWKDGNREGEGIFIAANGREEFIGTWKNDKIVPTKEGKDDARRSTLTDLTLSLLNGKSDIINHNSDMAETASGVEKTEGSISIEPEHQHRRELLGKVMHESLSTSLELLQKNVDQSHGDNGKVYPHSWPSDCDSLSISKDPKACLRHNAIKLLEMESKTKGSICDSDMESDMGCQEIDTKSDISGNAERSSQTQMMHYPNGDSYLGEICSETKSREGYGVYLSCATGSTYSGDFRLGLRHGFGILMHPLGKYCGDFIDDEKHGMGTLILNDSSSYFGEFFKGNIHGRGTLCEKNGTVYVGEWVNGIRDGDGYETLMDGSVYMGEYKAGKRHGVGTMLAKSGGPVTYSGSWSEGLYHGEGVAVQRVNPPSAQAITGSTSVGFDSESDSNVSIVQYEGSFVCGQLDGFGTLTTNSSAGSVVAKGYWRKNVPLAGKWRIQFADGSIYSGQAKSEEISGNDPLSGSSCNHSHSSHLSDWNITTPMPDGFGTMMYSIGDLFIGNFVGKTRHGIGTCQFANGDCWEGDWINDTFDTHGNGTMTLVNGKVHRYHKKS